MKKVIILLIAVFFTAVAFSQDMKSFKLYKPEENAEDMMNFIAASEERLFSRSKLESAASGMVESSNPR